MKETLLEIAKKVPIRKIKVSYTDEDIELAIAWMKSEVTTKQISVAKGMKTNTGNHLYHIASSLREAYRKGRIISVK